MPPESNEFTIFVLLLQNWFVKILHKDSAAQIHLRKKFDILELWLSCVKLSTSWAI